MIALVGISEEWSWWGFVPGLALAGIGSGVVNAALAGMAVRSVPAHRVAMGSGANNTSRYVGSSVGIALIGAVLALASGGEETAHEFASGMSYGALVAGVLAIAGAILVALCRERVDQDNAVVIRKGPEPENLESGESIRMSESPTRRVFELMIGYWGVEGRLRGHGTDCGR